MTGTPHSPPVLSVVVIGRNEGKRLAACIKSVFAMHPPGVFEGIYVDSDSTDNSLAVESEST